MGEREVLWHGEIAHVTGPTIRGVRAGGRIDQAWIQAWAINHPTGLDRTPEQQIGVFGGSQCQSGLGRGGAFCGHSDRNRVLALRRNKAHQRIRNIASRLAITAIGERRDQDDEALRGAGGQQIVERRADDEGRERHQGEADADHAPPPVKRRRRHGRSEERGHRRAILLLRLHLDGRRGRGSRPSGAVHRPALADLVPQDAQDANDQEH